MKNFILFMMTQVTLNGQRSARGRQRSVKFIGNDLLLIEHRNTFEQCFAAHFLQLMFFDGEMTSTDLMKSSINFLFLGHINSNNISSGYVCPSTTRNIRSWLVYNHVITFYPIRLGKWYQMCSALFNRNDCLQQILEFF